MSLNSTKIHSLSMIESLLSLILIFLNTTTKCTYTFYNVFAFYFRGIETKSISRISRNRLYKVSFVLCCCSIKRTYVSFRTLLLPCIVITKNLINKRGYNIDSPYWDFKIVSVV